MSVNAKITNILASSDRDVVTTGYMAIAKFFVDHIKDKTRYKVSLSRYLYKLNEMVIIDIHLISAMVVEHIEFYNYVNTPKLRRFTSFSDVVGVEYCFTKAYMSCVDKNISTYNEMLALLNRCDIKV